MKRTWYLIFIILGLLIIIYFLISKGLGVNTTQENSLQLQLNQLRGVSKLVIWEQDFTLNHVEKMEKDYIGIFKTSEKINSQVNGKMGFHIDLADSVNTKIFSKGDTVIVMAPLKNTFIELDFATLIQTKEASLDPTLEIKKEEVIKKLRQRALEEFVPNLSSHLSKKNLEYQEEKLAQLINKKVKIYISSYPTQQEMIWKR